MTVGAISRAVFGLTLIVAGFALSGPAAAQSPLDTLYQESRRGDRAPAPVAAAPRAPRAVSGPARIPLIESYEQPQRYASYGNGLFGIFERPPSAVQQLPDSRSVPGDTRPAISRTPSSGSNGGVGGSTSGSTTRAYCVRSCDGFFFPAGYAGSEDESGRRSQESYCQSVCPGAETALYTTRSGAIEQAISSRGKPYTALRTAFQFRTKIDAACTCSGGLTTGLASLPITHDRSLRAGDVVVMENGVRVFRGASRFPYRLTDFQSLSRYSRLPANLHAKVREIERMHQSRLELTVTPRLRPTGRLATVPQVSEGDTIQVRQIDLPTRDAAAAARNPARIR